jgi:hypothetical protein
MQSASHKEAKAMSIHNKEAIDQAIAALNSTQWDASWRWDVLKMAIKLIELARQERLSPEHYNAYPYRYLRKVVTLDWLFKDVPDYD